jgi:hypothetical protein
MKKNLAVILSLCFLAQGSAFAATALTDDAKLKKTVAFETASRAPASRAASVCAGGVCEVNSCGAYVSKGKFYGYGFGTSKEAATSKAMKMCGPNGCEVVVAACEE